MTLVFCLATRSIYTRAREKHDAKMWPSRPLWPSWPDKFHVINSFVHLKYVLVIVYCK